MNQDALITLAVGIVVVLILIGIAASGVNRQARGARRDKERTRAAAEPIDPEDD